MTQDSKPLLPRSKFLRLGLVAAKKCKPDLTSNEWEQQCDDLLEQWYRIVMLRYKNEHRTNTGRTEQVLRTKPVS
jgi:hypothetical protein